MFCQKCGNQQLDDEMFCGKCGTPFASNTYAPQRYDVEGEAKEIHIVHDVYTDKDRPSCLVNFLCFIFPKIICYFFNCFCLNLNKTYHFNFTSFLNVCDR